MSPDVRIAYGGWYTATQASRALGVSRMTLWRYSRKGILKTRFRYLTDGEGRSRGVQIYSGAELLKIHEPSESMTERLVRRRTERGRKMSRGGRP